MDIAIPIGMGSPRLVLDFMAKVAALVPKPRTNLTGPPLCPLVQVRFHGVLAPNSRYRESVTPLSVRKKRRVGAPG